MNQTFEFKLTGRSAPSLLPRITMALSRRRVMPRRLDFAVQGEDGCAIALEIECPARDAERLRARLAQIVEVSEVAMHLVAARPEPLPVAV